ncbi:MAG: UDP-2,3-diacylglucosamine diphosphatase LpxI [Candidatus Omnitrophota bacterium]
MKRVGLIAGGGTLPIEFIRSAVRQKEQVIVFALKGMALPEIEGEGAKRVYWMDIGQYKKFAFLLLKDRVRKLALIGKVRKNVIYEKEDTHDKEYSDGLKNMKNKKDYSILEDVTGHLARIGVEVIDSIKYLAHLMPEKGVLGGVIPNKSVEEDMQFGYDTAKKLAGMDIGQTIIVKDKTVVAVEAMEGTDAAIERGYEIAGQGCVMVKVSRPEQDMRWDIPTVGAETMQNLIKNKYKALAIESKKMFLVDKQKVIDQADSAGIVVQAL